MAEIYSRARKEILQKARNDGKSFRANRVEQNYYRCLRGEAAAPQNTNR